MGSKKQKRDRSKFDKNFVALMLHTVVPVLKHKYGVVRNEYLRADEESFLLLFNHVTDLDMVWIMDAFHRQIYCLGSEHIARFPLAGKLLNTFFAPILIKKGSSGMAAVMEMHRCLKAGNSILMSPEGILCAAGRTGELVPSTAAVIKKLHCNVITVRIHGGYLTKPRWAKTVRKGQITVEKIAEYSKDSIASMDPAEFQAIIEKDLYEDAYAYNETAKIAYKGKNLAEGIECQLYLCPSCKKLATLHSLKNDFFCDCGLKGTIDEYGMISGEGFDFKTVTEWDEWQESELKNMPLPKDTETVIVSNPNLSIKEIKEGHKESVIGTGTLQLTSREISVGEVRIPLSEISDVAMVSHGILLIYTKDKHYYEIRNKKNRYPGVLYKKLIARIKED